MEVYRLVREKYATPLSGVGASLKGARWNSPGTELIYTAINRSLAMAEVAVHLTLATLPEDYLMVTIHVPEDISVEKISADDLPVDWKEFPHPSSSQRIGDQFVQKKEACILIVPSAVTQGDFNILINPKHPEFGKISIIKMEKFPFDHRIFK